MKKAKELMDPGIPEIPSVRVTISSIESIAPQKRTDDQRQMYSSLVSGEVSKLFKKLSNKDGKLLLAGLAQELGLTLKSGFAPPPQPAIADRAVRQLVDISTKKAKEEKKKGSIPTSDQKLINLKRARTYWVGKLKGEEKGSENAVVALESLRQTEKAIALRKAHLKDPTIVEQFKISDSVSFDPETDLEHS
jgi:hypothetical protein